MIVKDNLPPIAARATGHETQLDHEVSLIDVLASLRQHARWIFGITLGVTALATVIVFLIPVQYRSESVIMPPAQASSVSALAAGTLSGLATGGMASQLGLKNPADLYVGVLTSRTIVDSLIARFNLRAVYGTATQADTRKLLAKRSKIESGKDTLIHIAVDDRDPQRAADLANAYVEELYHQNSRLALTDASQRRKFYEERLADARKSLAAAEVDLKTRQEQTGLVMPTGQGEALIQSAARLRAELTSREVALEALRSYATDQNPRIETLRREIASLREQVARLEGSGPRDGARLSAGALPQAGLEYMRALREVKYHETLMELLAKQHEIAVIDEAKSAPLVQVVDRAVPADQRSWPPRALLIVAAAALAAFVAALVALVRNYRRTIVR